MQVTLNGEQQALDLSDCANMAELVALAERVGVDEGEDCVVVGLEVDGERLSPEEMSGLEARPLGDVRSVAIERRPARAVARSVLRQGADYTGEVQKALVRTVDHLRSGRLAEAHELFAHVTDSLTVLVGISSSAAGVLGRAGEGLLERQGELIPWLEELVEAQSAEDPIQIGDLLEFEVAPRLVCWADAMRAQAEACDGSGGDGDDAELDGDPPTRPGLSS